MIDYLFAIAAEHCPGTSPIPSPLKGRSGDFCGNLSRTAHALEQLAAWRREDRGTDGLRARGGGRSLLLGIQWVALMDYAPLPTRRSSFEPLLPRLLQITRAELAAGEDLSICPHGSFKFELPPATQGPPAASRQRCPCLPSAPPPPPTSVPSSTSASAALAWSPGTSFRRPP